MFESVNRDVKIVMHGGPISLMSTEVWDFRAGQAMLPRSMDSPETAPPPAHEAIDTARLAEAMPDLVPKILKLGTVFVTKDPLLLVLQAHLLIEQYLVSYICGRLPELDEDRFTRRYGFERKVELASALGAFPSSHVPAYLKVNDLRNRAAHQLGYAIGAKDERDLYNALTHAQRNVPNAAPVEKPRPGGFPSSLHDALFALVLELDDATLEARKVDT